MASRTDTDGNSKLIHFLDLSEYGLDEVPIEARLSAKSEVRDYLENAVLRKVNKGVSPVKGEGRFKILDAKYASNFKGGIRTPNLELEGELKDSYRTEIGTGSYLEIGFKDSQTKKADGHNQISNKAKTWAQESKMPKRRFIPDTGQKYTEDIEQEIRSIIKEFIPSGSTSTRSTVLDDLFETEDTGSASDESISVSIDNVFSDDVIEALLQDAARRRE